MTQFEYLEYISNPDVYAEQSLIGTYADGSSPEQYKRILESTKRELSKKAEEFYERYKYYAAIK